MIRFSFSTIKYFRHRISLGMIFRSKPNSLQRVNIRGDPLSTLSLGIKTSGIQMLSIFRRFFPQLYQEHQILIDRTCSEWNGMWSSWLKTIGAGGAPKMSNIGARMLTEHEISRLIISFPRSSKTPWAAAIFIRRYFRNEILEVLTTKIDHKSPENGL